VFLFKHYLLYGKSLSGVLFFILPPTPFKLYFRLSSIFPSFFLFLFSFLFPFVSLIVYFHIFVYSVAFTFVFVSFSYLHVFLCFSLSGPSVMDIRINLNEFESYNIFPVTILTSHCNLIQKTKIQ